MFSQWSYKWEQTSDRYKMNCLRLAHKFSDSLSFVYFYFLNFCFLTFLNAFQIMNAMSWCALCSVRYVKSQKRFNLFVSFKFYYLRVHFAWYFSLLIIILFCHVFRFFFSLLLFDVCSNLHIVEERLFNWNIKIFGRFVWFVVVDKWSWIMTFFQLISCT